MAFREQYENALTIRADAASENIPASYFAGVFYEQRDDCANRIPTILSGGSVKIGEALSLSYKPLSCRMLLYTQEGEGTLLLEGQRHPLKPGTLLYLDRSELSFSLQSTLQPWRFITFSLGGGAFFRLRISDCLRWMPSHTDWQTFFRAQKPETASRRGTRHGLIRQTAGRRPHYGHSDGTFRGNSRLSVPGRRAEKKRPLPAGAETLYRQSSGAAPEAGRSGKALSHEQIPHLP